MQDRPSRAALAGTLAWIAAAAISWPASRAWAQVVVITSSAADQEVALQLGNLIDVPVQPRAAPQEPSRGRLLEDAASWPEPYVVVIDRQNDMVQVWRPRDHTAVSRVLAADVMVDSQYAVALATAELLEWLGVLPAATGRPAARAHAGTPAPTAQEPEPLAPPDGSPLGWAAGADLELATSPGFDLSLVRPSLSVELQTGRARAAPWFALGGRFGAPASWDRALEGTALTGAKRIAYSDMQAALHVGIGIGAARASVLGQLEGGVSLSSVEASTRTGPPLDHSRVSGWLGLGLQLRYPLISALCLAAAVQGQLRLAPARYRIEGVEVLEEGPIGVVTRLGLIWESALLP